MIFNPERNYLFIHIQKTAGTSITRMLCAQQGSIFISPAHLLRCQTRFRLFRRPFTFAVVRNPWERLVSWWDMMQRKGRHNAFSDYLLADKANGASVDFSSFIRRTAVIEETEYELADTLSFPEIKSLKYVGPRVYRKSLSFNQLDYLTDCWGLNKCDMTIYYDCLTKEWPKLVRILHPEQKLEDFPRENVNPCPAHDWRKLYSDPTDRDWVAKLYNRDIARFGFRFDQEIV